MQSDFHYFTARIFKCDKYACKNVIIMDIIQVYLQAK